jgi:two-component sensor histidine kinase
MTLHELATNATKHGALSVPTGRVAVEWRRNDDGSLGLRWSETGGPPIGVPTRQGTGTSVIMRCIQDQLGGEVRVDWRPQGLVCMLVMPTGFSAA